MVCKITYPAFVFVFLLKFDKMEVLLEDYDMIRQFEDYLCFTAGKNLEYFTKKVFLYIAISVNYLPTSQPSS